MDHATCLRRLQWFADRNGLESPLYAALARAAADDPGLLALIQQTPDSQPVPALFLAVLHELLLDGSRHQLARYYATCVDNPLPSAGVGPALRDFCQRFQHQIYQRLGIRRVQTNEVGRCAYLYPALAWVAQETSQPLSLIEVGTSAGLNLCLDRFRYEYSDGQVLGLPDARSTIRSQWRGSGRPKLTKMPFGINWRMGIDLQVLDVNRESDARWLQALIWPDQPERLRTLKLAIDEFCQAPEALQQGCAFDLLPNAVRSAPASTLVCVLHTHTLNQFTEADRVKFAELLDQLSSERPIAELSAEWLHSDVPRLVYTHRRQGNKEPLHLANVHQHGSWIEWLNPSTPRV